MGALIDLAGREFSAWTVLARHGTAWLCRCRCGAERSVDGHSLRSGASASCGCAPRPSRVVDLTGRRFGRLVVERRDGNENADGSGQAMWLVRCDCAADSGQFHRVAGGNLRRGLAQSCGCVRAESLGDRSTTHGLTRGGTRHPLYSTWANIRGRCHNPKSSGFAGYGAKGVTMCGRWRGDFAAFVADIGPRPSPDHSVDRIDVRGGYWCGRVECSECAGAGRSPNCRWATRIEQARNTTRNRNLTINGVTKCLAEWAMEFGISAQVVAGRIARGASPEDAVRDPVRGHYRRRVSRA